MRRAEIACRGRRSDLSDIGSPLDLESMVPGDGPWELEVGFGKGRYLLRRAAEDPAVRLVGIEVAAKYFRMVERRRDRRRLDNVILLLGEANYLMSTMLPSGRFQVAHVYFPDPWPKDRHHKRRLFDHDSIDLLLRVLAPGGRLAFATDHLDYGALVAEMLESHPALSVERLESWPEGARTNYEAKYEREGREILRLEARLRSGRALVHPHGETALTVGVRADGHLVDAPTAAGRERAAE